MLAVPAPRTPTLTFGVPAALVASRKTCPASGEVMTIQSNMFSVVTMGSLFKSGKCMW
nr:hypothetical protein Iba_chr14aCG19040 [Ipomoea batatas]